MWNSQITEMKYIFSELKLLHESSRRLERNLSWAQTTETSHVYRLRPVIRSIDLCRVTSDWSRELLEKERKDRRQ